MDFSTRPIDQLGIEVGDPVYEVNRLCAAEGQDPRLIISKLCKPVSLGG